MSLIDANEAYKIARSSGRHDDFGRCMADLTSLKELLEDCTTVDAVEVVRCRECANGYVSSGSFTGMRCKKWGCYDTDYECRPDGFCSYGERRE